jgi:hypothetical protein
LICLTDCGFNILVGGLGKVGGAILGLAGAVIALPALILSIPGIMIARSAQRPGAPPVSAGLPSRIGTGLYFGAVGIIGLPALLVSTAAAGLSKASDYALQDSQTFQYKQILEILIGMIGENSSDIVDEVTPLEDFFVTSFATRFPGCDLSRCSREELLTTISNAVADGSLSAANFVKTIRKVPIILDKMRLVGRIRSIRRLLQRNLMLAFLGIEGSGRSTTLKRLFDVSVPATEPSPTKPLPGLAHTQRAPYPYILGKWVEETVAGGAGEAITETLNAWFLKKERDSLQVYAIDFPGIERERDARSFVDETESFASVASIFVLFFTAGSMPTDSEKKLVDIAKAQHKPFLIILNKCDAMESELNNPGSYETKIDAYASALDVPADIIHFMSSFDAYSNDKLRGILFGLLQNIVGDVSLNDTLALRFLPEHVLKELQKDNAFNVLSYPGTLSKAAASLMFNLCPLTSGTLGDMYAMMLADQESSLSPLSRTPSVGSANLLNISFSTSDQIRQVAAGLKVPDATYSIFYEAFSHRLSIVQSQLSKLNLANSALPADVKARMDNAVSLIALSSLRDQVSQYFGTIASSNRDDVGAISREVLLGIHQMTELWVERGYQQNVVAEVLKSICSAVDPISDSHILTLLLQAASRDAAIATLSGDDHTHTHTHTKELDSYGTLEFNKFYAAKDRLNQLSKVVVFQPFPEFSLSRKDGEDKTQELTVDKFRLDVAKWEKQQSSRMLLTLSSSESLLAELLERLSSMTESQMEKHNVSFQILSESGVDASGVTRAILSKVAEEINAHPELVCMKKDEDSGLIYFDSSACCNSMSAVGSFEQEAVLRTFRGLGRLIGLSLVKSNAGATLPVSFPITFYKLLLGYRIGMDDLSIISPQVVNSIRSISILDGETLEQMELTFVVSSGDDHKTYDLVVNGSSKLVTEHNVMSYVKEVVKYYLCCQDVDPSAGDEGPRNPLRQFLLGMEKFVYIVS